MISETAPVELGDFGYYPMSQDNMEKAGLVPREPPMKQLPESLQLIPLFALIFAFMLLGVQELSFA
jgi:hypothetical protein